MNRGGNHISRLQKREDRQLHGMALQAVEALPKSHSSFCNLKTTACTPGPSRCDQLISNCTTLLPAVLSLVEHS